ncbi:YIR014W [Zygosaccharomyces parabailii]|nr:YIR014W [Zygosaccharomyces parabailii]
MSGGSHLVRQLTVVSYACVYLRFVKDGSLLLAVLAWATVSLSEFMGGVLAAYLDEEEQGHVPVVKAVLFKGLRYTQVILMVQVLYGCLYHLRLDVEKDVCRHKLGYMVLLLVGEQDCGRGGRWILLALDWVILLTQLVLVTMALSSERSKARPVLPQLNTERYGVLAVLQFDPWSTAEENPFVTRGNNYGST